MVNETTYTLTKAQKEKLYDMYFEVSRARWINEHLLVKRTNKNFWLKTSNYIFGVLSLFFMAVLASTSFLYWYSFISTSLSTVLFILTGIAQYSKLDENIEHHKRFIGTYIDLNSEIENLLNTPNPSGMHYITNVYTRCDKEDIAANTKLSDKDFQSICRLAVIDFKKISGHVRCKRCQNEVYTYNPKIKKNTCQSCGCLITQNESVVKSK